MSLIFKFTDKINVSTPLDNPFKHPLGFKVKKEMTSLNLLTFTRYTMYFFTFEYVDEVGGKQLGGCIHRPP